MSKARLWGVCHQQPQWYVISLGIATPLWLGHCLKLHSTCIYFGRKPVDKQAYQVFSPLLKAKQCASDRSTGRLT